MRKILAVLFITILFTVHPLAAEAHETETDGAMSGVLHMEPDDDAVAQKHTTLMFTLTDQSKKFAIEKCDCELTISVPGKLPYTQKITTPAAATNGLYSVMVPFTFPRGGTYDITFVGKPTTADAFQPFNLQWHETVKAANNEIQTLKTPKQTASQKMLPIAGGVLLVLIGAGLFIYNKRKNKSA